MNQKGITLIQLVITIVVMIILASMAIFQGGNVTTEAMIAREYESLREVKKAVEQTVLLMEMNPEDYKEEEIFGGSISKDAYYKRVGLTSSDELSDRTYSISKSNEKNFELDKIPDEKVYIVDLENKKYYILDGVQKEDGEIIYEYKDILKIYNMLSGQN